MLSNEDLEEIIVRAANNTDAIRAPIDFRVSEQRNLVTESEARDIELALKLSVEFQNAMTDQRLSTSPVHLNNSSTSNVELNEDEDFKFALKLSAEMNERDLSRTSPASNSASVSSISAFDRDDFELAVKLSKELNEHDSSSTIRATFNANSMLNIAPFDQDEDFKLAVKLSEELNTPHRIELPPSTSYADSKSASNVVTLNENEDFELALKLSIDLNRDPPKPSSSSSPTASSVKDQDFELALKLSAELNGQYLQTGVPSTSQNDTISVTDLTNGTPFPEAGNPNEWFELASDDEDDIIVDRVVREIIASEQAKSVGRSRVRSPPKSQKPAESESVKKYLSQDISIVDPSWETIDPVPDVYAMFVAFNRRFFWGRLDMVEVQWSPRMTVCAGICTYSKRAGHCIVKLSKPLLQLRPRKDMVETLLHEMIHAYLFVTKNDRDRDGHGPRFHSHMYRINKESGANITVYHTFHDEVRYYKQHEWRCNGPCRNSPPFYGYVRRSMNRAPGPNDNWWSDHAARCNGQFVKTKEPEGFGVKKPAAESKNSLVVKEKGSQNSIENYFKTMPSKTGASLSGQSSALKLFTGANAAATNITVRTPLSNQKAPGRTPFSNQRIFTLKDLLNKPSPP